MYTFLGVIALAYIAPPAYFHWRYADGWAGLSKLTPRRLHKFNKAIVQFMSSVQYAPLMLKWTYFYRKAGKELLRKDKPYGENGNLLDVHIPKQTSTRANGFPVVVFLYGGAWDSGDKNIYPLLGRKLADAGFLVFLPNYKLYPHGTINSMLSDVASAVAYARQHASSYGGDPTRIILMGHSAGAHLCSLTLCSAAFQTRVDTHVLDSVVGCVGLSGPYSIKDHYGWESMRGVELVSCMGRLMGGTSGWSDNSPTELVAMNSPTAQRKLPCFALLHGHEDKTVPYTSSKRFACALRKAGVPVFEQTMEGMGHADFVIEPMSRTRPGHERILSAMVDATHWCLEHAGIRSG